MVENKDRLYELLPKVYRQRDIEQGEPLRAFLQVIAEQVAVVEGDIAQLYENWFIETSQDWVVPYIGDLVGYEQVHEAGQPGDVATEQGRLRNKILTPRSEVGNTIRNRRRKGTLALLELLARDVANWPARAVEFYTLLSVTQGLNHLRLDRGRTLELRKQDVVDRIDGPFDTSAHTIDIRRASSLRTRGKYNIPNIGLFVWRLRSYSITRAQAYRREVMSPHFYFSILSNNSKLYNAPVAQDDPTRIASEINLPVPIKRGVMAENPEHFYGKDKSIFIWIGKTPEKPVQLEKIVVRDLSNWEQNQLGPGLVAIDPEEGRIAFHQDDDDAPKDEEYVWVFFHYGFPADIGGGEYLRPISQLTSFELGADGFAPGDVKNENALAAKLHDRENALMQHLQKSFSSQMQEKLRTPGANGTPEMSKEMLSTEIDRLIQGECIYDRKCFEQAGVKFSDFNAETRFLLKQNPAGTELNRLNRLLFEQVFTEEVRAGFKLYSVGLGKEFDNINKAIKVWDEEKPLHAVIEITDNREYVENLKIQFDERENQSLQLRAANGRRPVIRVLDFEGGRIDALRVIGKNKSRFFLDGILVAGRGIRFEGGLCELAIRHTTLVPGWSLHPNCDPRRPTEQSLYLKNLTANVSIQNSIIGSVQIQQNEVDAEPLKMSISDSIIDATSAEEEAIAAPRNRNAFAILTIARSTIMGVIRTHAIELAENSILQSCTHVARRQHGCIRFSYVTPDSRTPRRYNCQPDLVVKKVRDKAAEQGMPDEERKAEEKREALRVKPAFNSETYGKPEYFQLAQSTAVEIKRGADDESEMGVYHDLFQPQREANLRIRLNEYTPAGMDAGIFFAS